MGIFFPRSITVNDKNISNTILPGVHTVLREAERGVMLPNEWPSHKCLIVVLDLSSPNFPPSVNFCLLLSRACNHSSPVPHQAHWIMVYILYFLILAIFYLLYQFLTISPCFNWYFCIQHFSCSSFSFCQNLIAFHVETVVIFYEAKVYRR